jgi:hypothetical protein
MLDDACFIYEELGELQQGEEGPDEAWAVLRRRVDSHASERQWSPCVQELLGYLEQAPSAQRREWCGEGNRDALVEGLVQELMGSEELFTAEVLWSALCEEMTRKVAAGDIPRVRGSVAAVQKRLLEVAWFTVLGQPTGDDAVDVWVRRCLDGAQRNIGIDLSRPEAVEVLRSNTGGAFSALRHAAGPIAEILVAANEQREQDVRAMASPEGEGRPGTEPGIEGGDPLDGVSLRILFGEVDMQTVLEDEELAARLKDLLDAGLLSVWSEEVEEFPFS